jgi:hypothetical protein
MLVAMDTILIALISHALFPLLSFSNHHTAAVEAAGVVLRLNPHNHESYGAKGIPPISFHLVLSLLSALYWK